MPTQEERLNALERNTTANIHDLQANTTILLGIAQSQGQDIRRVLQQLSIMDGRLNLVDGRLNIMDGRQATIEATLNEHTTLLNQHTTLLTEILARLPEKL